MSIQDDDVVKSVGRVFAVLQLFDERREPLNATQVERALDYPQSSTLALLKSMVKLGYLAFDRLDRTYVPTMRVATLGHWIETAFHGEGRLAGLLNDLSRVTPETVCLSIQNDLVMQFTHVRLGTEGLILRVAPGDFAPLFRSAIGYAALSARPDNAVKLLVQRFNRRTRNPAERVEAEELLRRVRRVRTAGYAVGYDLYVPDIGAVAWPLRPTVGRHSIVLSVGGPSNRVRAREAVIIRRARAAIRTHLGS